jgi:hypothetical protein
MKHILILIIILYPILAYSQNDEQLYNDKSYIFFNFKAGYRSPTGNTSSLGSDVKFEETKSSNIYEPSFAWGINVGLVYNKYIFAGSIEGGDLPYTNKGQNYANQKNTSWGTVKSEYAAFELFFGYYFYSNSFVALYGGISAGFIDMQYYKEGYSPINEDYNTSALSLGCQIHPFDSKFIYFVNSIKYPIYISGSTVPKDIIILFGVGIRLQKI